jgi:hypothetical protein
MRDLQRLKALRNAASAKAATTTSTSGRGGPPGEALNLIERITGRPTADWSAA